MITVSKFGIARARNIISFSSSASGGLDSDETRGLVAPLLVVHVRRKSRPDDPDGIFLRPLSWVVGVVSLADLSLVAKRNGSVVVNFFVDDG